MNAVGRAQAKSRFPDAKVTQVARYCGETWHSMTPQEKEKWEKMAADLKAMEKDRYATALAAAPKRRKRPPSSYMLWMNEQGREYTKNQYPELKATEIVSFCGRFWREMPAEEKRRWQQKALELKQEYERNQDWASDLWGGQCDLFYYKLCCFTYFFNTVIA